MIAIGLHGGGRMRIDDRGVIDVSDVTPEVLAYGLANVTRFGGQAGHYSDAEHSVRMFDWAREEGQDKAILLGILLHDAAECLGEGDTQRFVKRFYPTDGLRKFSHAVSEALWAKFHQEDRPLAQWPWDMIYSALKPYDNFIGSLEARAFGFPHDPIPDWLTPKWAPDPRHLWCAERGLMEFLIRWSMCQ